jgi:hypothetical protein
LLTVNADLDLEDERRRAWLADHYVLVIVEESKNANPSGVTEFRVIARDIQRASLSSYWY